MAFPTGTFTATDLAAVIPEIWSKKVNEFFRAKLVAANFFTDMSDDVAGGGDTIHIPSLTELSANDKSNAAAVTLNSPTESTIDLSINTWKECSFAIEDKEARQVLRSYNIQKRYAQAAAYAIAKALDSALLGLYAGLSTDVGNSASDISDAFVIDAIKNLDENDVPAEDRAFFFYPSVMWTAYQTIQKYYDASQAGWNSDEAPVKNGPRGVLYGIPVYVTTQVPITNTTWVHNMLAHKDAFVYAKAGDIRLQSNYIPEYLSTLTTADLIYGVAENRDAAAVEISTTK